MQDPGINFNGPVGDGSTGRAGDNSTSHGNLHALRFSAYMWLDDEHFAAEEANRNERDQIMDGLICHEMW